MWMNRRLRKCLVVMDIARYRKVAESVGKCRGVC
jgi:hypothetical protein